MSKNIFSVWLKNGRVGATMQSLMPSILAVTIAIGAETFSWWIAAIAVLGVWCAHMACNLLDDYFDYKADMLKDRERHQSLYSQIPLPHRRLCHRGTAEGCHPCFRIGGHSLWPNHRLAT